jgi:hypothetical protein
MRNKYQFIGEFLADPRCAEGRLVVVCEQTGALRGYVSQDGNKVVEVIDKDGKSIDNILTQLEAKCKQIIGE